MQVQQRCAVKAACDLPLLFSYQAAIVSILTLGPSAVQLQREFLCELGKGVAAAVQRLPETNSGSRPTLKVTGGPIITWRTSCTRHGMLLGGLLPVLWLSLDLSASTYHMCSTLRAQVAGAVLRMSEFVKIAAEVCR